MWTHGGVILTDDRLAVDKKWPAAEENQGLHMRKQKGNLPKCTDECICSRRAQVERSDASRRWGDGGNLGQVRWMEDAARSSLEAVVGHSAMD